MISHVTIHEIYIEMKDVELQSLKFQNEGNIEIQDEKLNNKEHLSTKLSNKFLFYTIIICISLGFLIYLIINVKIINCEQEKYICEYISLSNSCMTQVYQYSEYCFSDQNYCDILRFRDCDNCGYYAIACDSGNDKCPFEGKFTCYFYKLINGSDIDKICYPNKLSDYCPSQINEFIPIILMSLSLIVELIICCLMIFPIIKIGFNTIKKYFINR